MSEVLLQAGASNALWAGLLALLAFAVGKYTRRPGLAYMLWLLVFIKLLTPPLITIPVETIHSPQSAASVTGEHGDLMYEVLPLDSRASSKPLPADQDIAGPGSFSLSAVASSLSSRTGAWLLVFWILGSLFLLFRSTHRVIRFNRLLGAQTDPAPDNLLSEAQSLAHQLELSRVPEVLVTSASLSPMVWWSFSRVKIVIPEGLLGRMETEEWRWILAHELAHVKRGDYLIRWIEWLGCVLFWWNPVTWWAQRNLRAMEEVCCDLTVISSLKPQPVSYANSLLLAVEYLASPAYRPPAMASELNSGGFFLRRCEMIIDSTRHKPGTLWHKGLILLLALLVLPLGARLVAAGDIEDKKKQAAAEKADVTEQKAYLNDAWAKLKQMVAAGKLTHGEAEAKFEIEKLNLYALKVEEEKYKAQIDAGWAELQAEIALGNITEITAKRDFEELKKQVAWTAQRIDSGEEDFWKGWEKSMVLFFEGYATASEVEKQIKSSLIELCPELAEFTGGDAYAVKLNKYYAAVESGEMTKAEAVDRMRAVELANYALMCETYAFDYHMAETWAHLERRVALGEITSEEAEAEMAKIQQKIQQKEQADQLEAEKIAQKEKQVQQEAADKRNK